MRLLCAPETRLERRKKKMKTRKPNNNVEMMTQRIGQKLNRSNAFAIYFRGEKALPVLKSLSKKIGNKIKVWSINEYHKMLNDDDGDDDDDWIWMMLLC